MARTTIAFTTTNADDEEETFQLPAKWEVCDDCEGVGRTLNENLRGAFTQEEFAECFETEEDQAEYMKGGHGIYGVPCKTCAGRTTVLRVDMDALQRQSPELARRYEEHLADERDYEAICAMERGMGA